MKIARWRLLIPTERPRSGWNFVAKHLKYFQLNDNSQSSCSPKHKKRKMEIKMTIKMKIAR
jgi:hypothetical protein